MSQDEYGYEGFRQVVAAVVKKDTIWVVCSNGAIFFQIHGFGDNWSEATPVPGTLRAAEKRGNRIEPETPWPRC